MVRLMLVSVAVSLLLGACSSDGEPVASDAPIDDANLDTSLVDVDDADAGTEPDAPPLAPAAYCESTIEMFCDYYLRCDRMATGDSASSDPAVDQMTACRVRFAEACNGRYEPIYVSLADAGLLDLSAEGIAECAVHLASVECDRQVNDLDGPCSAIWVGQAEVGAPCGLGIETFVCAEGSECVLGLDFCGTCESVVGLGDDCGADARCAATARCDEGVCVLRGLPGDTCEDRAECNVGLSCLEGVCRGREIVAVGDSCDQQRRCPYASVCVGGICEIQALIGESCAGPGWCASGWCDSTGHCAPLKSYGDPCNDRIECIGSCFDGTCVGPPSACIE